MKTRLKVTSCAFLTRLPVHISACSPVNYRSIDTNLPADGRCSRNEKASVGPSSRFPGSHLQGRLLAASPAIAVDLRALLPLLPCEDPSMPCAHNAACKKKRNTRRQFESSRRLLAARSRFAVWDAKTNFKMGRWLTASGWRERGRRARDGTGKRKCFSLFPAALNPMWISAYEQFSCKLWQGRKK